MSKLSELFKEVSEPNLGKTELENYHTQLSSLYAQMRLEMASCEKEESLFFMKMKEQLDEKGKEKFTDISIKRYWNVSESGQRLIELKNYTKGTEKLLSSLKNRLYGMPY